MLYLFQKKWRFDIGMLVYGAVILVALLWGILNYTGQLQRSAMCGRFESVEAFTCKLPMTVQDREDLTEYLNDFVKDLEENGKSHQDAVETAIGQFQIREITRSEGGLIESKPHYYLVGSAVICLGIALVIEWVNLAVHLPFPILAMSFMLVCYGLGFAGLFLIYRLADIVISSK